MVSIKILILTHYGWGQSLLKGIEMIIGKVDFVTECALEATSTLEEYTNLVDQKISELGSVAVIMTDMFGGTPNTVGLIMSKKHKIPVVCGLNAPLLLNACLKIQNQQSFDVEELIREAQESIFSASKKAGLPV